MEQAICNTHSSGELTYSRWATLANARAGMRPVITWQTRCVDEWHADRSAATMCSGSERIPYREQPSSAMSRRLVIQFASASERDERSSVASSGCARQYSRAEACPTKRFMPPAYHAPARR